MALTQSRYAGNLFHHETVELGSEMTVCTHVRVRPVSAISTMIEANAWRRIDRGRIIQMPWTRA
jgi:hypothetical protein